ncbi:MAG: hypothetical protein CL489_10595 [Acidobacteria bacterium]|nr:hypothetical protein [Acidobacteriota bacterium]
MLAFLNYIQNGRRGIVHEILIVTIGIFLLAMPLLICNFVSLEVVCMMVFVVNAIDTFHTYCLVLYRNHKNKRR